MNPENPEPAADASFCGGASPVSLREKMLARIPVLATSASSECLREDLEAEFLAAVAKANLVKSAYSTKQRLRLYSYYKQACLGDAPAAAPPAHLVVERTKHASCLLYTSPSPRDS